MNPEFTIDENSEIPMIECIYYVKDLVIEYSKPEEDNECLSERKERKFLVTANFLAISFDMSSRRLVAFDTYAPRSNWSIHDSFKIPKIAKKGQLLVLGMKDEESVMMEGNPQIVSSKNGSEVCIVIDEREPQVYAQVGRDLLVGLRGKSLFSIIMLNMKYID